MPIRRKALFSFWILSILSKKIFFVPIASPLRIQCYLIAIAATSCSAETTVSISSNAVE